MLGRYRDDWERVVAGSFHLSMDEMLHHRRGLPSESQNRDYVKSYGQKVIANALFEHAVEYRYELSHRWDGINYRPDFTIARGDIGGVIVETWPSRRRRV